jgi:hypothetical protein
MKKITSESLERGMRRYSAGGATGRVGLACGQKLAAGSTFTAARGRHILRGTRLSKYQKFNAKAQRARKDAKA